MNSIHREHHPPSGVQFGCQLSITPSTRSTSSGPKTTNLIIARSSYLRIYEIRSLPGSDDHRLFHIIDHHLHGIVTGLKPVRTLDSVKDGLDRLLISFKDAKMTLMEWSNSIYDLVPISLHTFERLSQLTGSDVDEIVDQLQVDPLSRCAILSLPKSTIAVLPFFQDHLDLDNLGISTGTVEDGHKRSNSEGQRIQNFSYAPSFVLDLNQGLQQNSPHLNNPQNESGHHDVSVPPPFDHRSIKSITSITFLPGFSEPTLAILYPSRFTWSGRLENVIDNHSMIFITLDLSSNHFTIIFQIDRLPYDSHQLVACPKELGGVIVICGDGLIHIDQSSKIVGIATNGWWNRSNGMNFIERQQKVKIIYEDKMIGEEELLVRLENSKLVFIRADRGLLFLNDGTVMSVWFFQDGRTLIRIELVKHLVRSVVPSCVMKVLEDEYVFVGSMLGDSVLLKLEEFWVEELDMNSHAGQIVGGHENGSGEIDEEVKRIEGEVGVESRGGGGGGEMVVEDHPMMEIDQDEEDIYGTSTDHQETHPNHNGEEENQPYSKTPQTDGKTRAKRKEIGLKLCDSIKGHGPIRDFTMAPVGPFDDSLEMLGCTGSGDMGGLTVFYREMPLQKRRKLDSTSESMKISRVECTLRPQLEDRGGDGSDQLVWFSIQDRTKIFSLKKVNREDRDEQKTNLEFLKTLGSFTITADLFFRETHQRFLLQVTRHQIKVLSHEFEEVQVIRPELSEGSYIRRAKIVEREYVLLEINDGTILLYEGNSETNTISKVPLPELAKPITAASLFKAHLPVYRQEMKGDVMVEKEVHMEDDGLYGEDLTMVKKEEERKKVKGVREEVNDREERTWLAVTDRDGDLHLLTVPELVVVFTVRGIDDLPEILGQNEEEDEEGRKRVFGDEEGDDHKEKKMKGKAGSEIEQICVFFTGVRVLRPHLSVELKSGAFAVYELLEAYERPTGIERRLGRPALILKKAIGYQFQMNESIDRSMKVREIREVSQLGVFSGIYISGHEPIWLISTDQGPIRLYLGQTDEVLAQIPKPGSESFVACTMGEKGETIVWETEIGDGICFDGQIPSRLVKFGRSFNKVVYDHTMGMVIGASYLETVFANFNEEGNRMWEQEDESLIRPHSFRSSLELILPGSWSTIDGHEFQQNEWVTSMKMVELDSKSKRCARREFIGVGTTCNRAEDLAARGGVYVFEVVEVMADSKHPERNRALRLRYHESTKACVTAVDGLNGYFVHTMGQKLYAKCFEQDERLLAVGFLDIRPYTTCLTVLKNFIVLGDAVKGITLIAFQEEPYKLIELGHTYVDLKCSTVDLLVLESKLGIVVSDLDGTLRIFEYNPTNIESQGGQRLLCRTEFRTASEMVGSMSFGKRLSSKDEPKVIGTLYAGLDGSISSLVPVKEAVFKRLQTVQTRLIRHLPHFAGLNPRGFRTVRNDYVSRAMNRGIVDGGLVERFERLSIKKQDEIGALAGSDRETVLVNMSNLRGFW